ncbi:IQ domain-containing protein M isoform X2 [Tamandua tetradactyla]|uniref:IQ domain-containing protein M isoform X2 n=1 Tax=Tamandua tetradactyla TaxID=48850 RepID=UPI004053C62D
MVTEEPVPVKEKRSTLETIRKDFFQEAKTLIAQHYEKINESKFQGTSFSVFRDKQQKRKSGIHMPLEIKKKEILDVVQEVWSSCRNIYFPKDLYKTEAFEESSKCVSFKEPCLFNIKEKHKESRDLLSNGQVKLSRIMTDIELVSKRMEKEKQQNQGKSRMLNAFPIHLGLSLHPWISSSTELLKENDKTFYDWRGIVSASSFRLPQESSQATFSASSILPEYCTKIILKKKQQPIKSEPKPKPRIKSVSNKSEKSDNKVKRIGPHIEIFQVFRERNKFVITKKIMRMITIMQARVRGWLERKRYQRLMTKALYHGSNLRIVINMYCKMIHRIRYRLGLWRVRQIVNFTELEEWMDRKKFYETMFAKREDWQGLERSELLKYFRECGHFPTQKQIDATWNLVNRMNGHPILKRANIRIVGKLVARSMRERKMKQYYKSLNI